MNCFNIIDLKLNNNHIVIKSRDALTHYFIIITIAAIILMI